MSPSKELVTRTDIDVISGELKALRQLMENELSHQAEDIKDLKDWRNEFMAEGGPWRSMDKRVSAIEYLTKGVKWVFAALTPIAVWATIEIIKAALAWAAVWVRGGP